METVKESSNIHNETYVTTSTTPVVVVPKPVAAVATPQLDSTYCVPEPEKEKKKNNSLPHDSIMTEDLSMAVEQPPAVKEEPIESPPRKPAKAVRPQKAASAKKAHEIFK